MDETLRIIVAADDPLVRAGLAALLASLPGCAVVVQGGNEILFGLSAAPEEPADLIVWDTGWAANDHNGEERFEASVPVLALVPDEDAAAAAWRLGSRSVVMREMNEERLAAAVVSTAAGLVVLAPQLVSALMSGVVAAETAPAVDLTPREIEVLALLAEGLTNKAVAQALTISDHTVKFHVNAILNKLDAQSRTDAVVRATRLGLISL
jgi:DNA-binding NarL/FixJ family response regulator